VRSIIAGGRNFNNFQLLFDRCNNVSWRISSVICGCASGADTLGEEYAILNNIPLKYFPADWQKFGKSAGMVRNKLMAENADCLIAFWDGTSKGTANMIEIAKKKKLIVEVFNY
jgi:hypothetical protein